jgi:4'-phosphopantetheinyl transferase
MPFKVYCQNLQNTSDRMKSGDLVVYHGLADCFVNKLSAFYDHLSDYEQTKADRFKHEADYSCYVTVHALLRIELSKLLGKKAKSISLGESEHGKPFVPGLDLPFSISRTRNLFAFAVGHSNQFLGVDIEQIKPEIDITNISRNYFSDKEQQLISSLKNSDDQKRTFFEIWTRKEALLKAIGIGINTELHKVQVLEGGNMLEIEGAPVDTHSFKIATALKKEALISVASSTDFVPEFKNLSFVL